MGFCAKFGTGLDLEYYDYYRTCSEIELTSLEAVLPKIVEKLNPPSTRLVRRVTLAAFLLPAGKLMPILSSLSRST